MPCMPVCPFRDPSNLQFPARPYTHTRHTGPLGPLESPVSQLTSPRKGLYALYACMPLSGPLQFSNSPVSLFSSPCKGLYALYAVYGLYGSRWVPERPKKKCLLWRIIFSVIFSNEASPESKEYLLRLPRLPLASYGGKACKA